MAHAGITPQWDLETAQQCARDVEAVLQRLLSFLPRCHVRRHAEPLEQRAERPARLRFISNAFTRMRYCFPNGQLDMYSKEAPEDAPAPLKPWFAIPGRSAMPTALPLATGLRWRDAAHRRIYARIPAAAGAGTHLPALGR